MYFSEEHKGCADRHLWVACVVRSVVIVTTVLWVVLMAVSPNLWGWGFEGNGHSLLLSNALVLLDLLLHDHSLKVNLGVMDQAITQTKCYLSFPYATFKVYIKLGSSEEVNGA